MSEMSHGSDKPATRSRPRSAILNLLDKFCDWVYDCLKNGVFGHIFTKYPDSNNTLFGRAAESSFRKNVVSPARRRLAAKMEESLFAKMYTKLISWLMCVKLRVYGVFFISFLLYSSLAAAVSYFRFEEGNFFGVILPVCISIAFIPIAMSGQTLAQSLEGSAIGRFLVIFTGSSFEKLDKIRSCGRANAAFLLGLVLGILTYFVHPVIVIAVLAALAVAALVFRSPEFGTVMLFFFVPILPTAILVALAALSMASFLLKVLLGKRVFRAEAVDLALIPFTVTILIGTLFGASQESLISGSMTLVFTLAFYLAVFTLTTRTWLRRAMVSMVFSGTLISFYGLLQYVTTKVADQEGWVDTEMFSYITGRAVATLDNPNMLAVFLILVLPIAVSMFLVETRGIRSKTIAFICIAAIGSCLIFTWTRGAWLGMLIAAVVFVMIWSRKSIYLFLCGVLAIPFLPYVVPANIWARFTSIGNTADSSTSYRINILNSVSELLPKYILHGLGCGEESWYVIYPKIALAGVEWTAHSHNLYVQIWIQTGLLSLILFLIFTVLLFLSSFNLFKKVSDAQDGALSRISVGPLKDSGDFDPAVEQTGEAKTPSRIKTVIRLEIAGPLCGVFAAIVMGFTDYIWYNYRVYLTYWLACGLASAFVRYYRRELDKNTGDVGGDESSSAVDILLNKKSERNG